jgi:hypothetical protein
VTRSKKTIAQTSQNDSMHALHDKVSVLEAVLNYYKERSTQYEECYRRFATGPQNRGKVVMEQGAGRAVPLLVAPQLRIESGGAQAQDMGMVAIERGVGGVLPVLGAPQPSIGMENKWDQRGAHGNISEDKGNAHPAKPMVARPSIAPQPQEVHLLTMVQTYAVAT